MEDKFIETLDNCFIHQYILSPTRCRGNTTPHILDLVLFNKEEIVSEIKHLAPLEAAITRLSHSSIVAMMTGQSHNINLIMAKGDFVGARLYLDGHPIRVDEDVDSMWDSFKKSYRSA